MDNSFFMTQLFDMNGIRILFMRSERLFLSFDWVKVNGGFDDN